MKAIRRTVVVLTTVLLTAAAGSGQQNPDARAAMERLKGLVGTWESVVKGGGAPQRMTYFLTGGGSVLVEDQRNANGVGGMMTAYHLDKNQLVLTHFCGAGNQPRMRLTSADERHVRFDMYDITNLADPQAYHSTSLDVIFAGKDRVDLVYGGQRAGTATSQTFQLTRAATK
jgi:hypothetical protein